VPFKNKLDRRAAERAGRAARRNLDRNNALEPVIPPCDGCPLKPLCEHGVVCAGFLHWVRFGEGGLTRARAQRGVDMSVWLDYIEADKARERKRQLLDPWRGVR
jgi:hypothetical protein